MQKKIINLSLAVLVFSFIGCGGGQTDTSTKDSSSYQSKLAQAPQIIQTAMNANPIQYVDANFAKSIGIGSSTNSIQYALTITAVPTKIDDNTGYSFITNKINDKTLTELVTGWQNSIYSIGLRQISSDSSISNFNSIENLAEVPELKAQNITPATLKLLANLLLLDTIKINCKFQIINNLAHYSHVVCTTGGTTKNLNDFDVPSDSTVGFQPLLKVCDQLLTNQ